MGLGIVSSHDCGQSVCYISSFWNKNYSPLHCASSNRVFAPSIDAAVNLIAFTWVNTNSTGSGGVMHRLSQEPDAHPITLSTSAT